MVFCENLFKVKYKIIYLFTELVIGIRTSFPLFSGFRITRDSRLSVNLSMTSLRALMLSVKLAMSSSVLCFIVESSWMLRLARGIALSLLAIIGGGGCFYCFWWFFKYLFRGVGKKKKSGFVYILNFLKDGLMVISSYLPLLLFSSLLFFVVFSLK